MKVRLLRGQVVVRETSAKQSVIWSPEGKRKDVRTHRGVVLGMGAPALNGTVEVEPGFKVGDVVQYHFMHHEEAHTREWPEDGTKACWIPQNCIDAVIEL